MRFLARRARAAGATKRRAIVARRRRGPARYQVCDQLSAPSSIRRRLAPVGRRARAAGPRPGRRTAARRRRAARRAAARPRRVGWADADHDLRVVGLVEQRLEMRDARGLEPLPGIGRAARSRRRPRRRSAARPPRRRRRAALPWWRSGSRASPGSMPTGADDVAHRRGREAALREGARRLVEEPRQAARGALGRRRGPRARA